MGEIGQVAGSQWSTIILQPFMYAIFFLEIPELKRSKWLAFAVSYIIFGVYGLIVTVAKIPMIETLWTRELIFICLWTTIVFLFCRGGFLYKFIMIVLGCAMASLVDISILPIAFPISIIQNVSFYDENFNYMCRLLVPGMSFVLIVLYLFIFNHCIKLPLLFAELLIDVFNVFTLVGIFIWSPDAYQSHYVYWTVYALFVLALQYTVYSSFRRAVLIEQKEAEIKQLHVEREMIANYNGMVANSLRQISITRHEMRNQLQLATAVLRESPAEADELIRKLEAGVEEGQLINISDSTLVNALLNMKMTEAREKGINIHVEGNISGWHLPEDDIVALFGNILDNAIEGCEAAQKANTSSEKSFINFYAGTQGNMPVITSENSADPTLNGLESFSASSKEDKSRHGYGQIVILSIVQKYNAEIKVSCQGGEFSVRIVFW